MSALLPMAMDFYRRYLFGGGGTKMRGNKVIEFFMVLILAGVSASCIVGIIVCLIERCKP
jgi:hypothetical protein